MTLHEQFILAFNKALLEGGFIHANQSGTLYHKDVYIPDKLRRMAMHFIRSNQANLQFSPHLIDHMNAGHDKSHYYTIEDILMGIDAIKVSNPDIFEVEEKDGQLLKVCFNIPCPFDEERTMAFVVNTEDNFIKTCWTNRINDKHRTLDTSRYFQKPKKHDL